jgi:hypothetical protein
MVAFNDLGHLYNVYHIIQFLMEQLMIQINEQVEQRISDINDHILEVQTAEDIVAIEERLTSIEQFHEFLKASCTMLLKYCAEQRTCIEEQRAALGIVTNAPNISVMPATSDVTVDYMENLTGTLVGYRTPTQSAKYAVQKEKIAVPEKNNLTAKCAVQKEKVVTQAPHNSTAVQEYKVVQLSQTVRLPACTTVQNITPALHVYDNQIYMCIYPGLYCRVPYPTTIDTNAADDRQRTVRCRALTRQACNERRRFIQQPCKYAHCGDRIVKVSSAGRCLSCPTFGNPESWGTDSEQVTERDIRTVLMYGLSDLVAVACWAANKKIKGVWHDLDVA